MSTPRRTFRAGDVWDEALEWAKRRDESVSSVLVTALEEYVDGAKRDEAWRLAESQAIATHPVQIDVKEGK